MCGAFLWNGAPNSARGAKISWDSVCTPKEAGGLGLRRLADWNRVLGLKLIWLIFTAGGSLWVSWVRRNLIARHLATPHVISVAAPRLPPSVAETKLPSQPNHSFQPETSGYSVHVAMFTRSCLAEDDTLITQLFVKRCSLVSVIVEVDRILRPQGTFIVNDGMEKIGEIEKMMESLKWNVRMTHSRYGEGVISVQKSWWRPTEVETITSAIESERELV
ncbi:hypothetical protein YC2023_109691 [Brassica napus]